MEKSDLVTENKPKPVKIEFGKDPYRFVIISLYLVQMIIVGLLNNPLTPIATTTMKVYDITGDKVALTTSVCQFSNILMSFPAINLVGRMGIRVGIIIGVFLMALGLSVRVMINTNIYYVIVGQMISGIGVPFVGGVLAKVITEWFDSTERGIWIALASLAAPIGAMIGFVVPLFFIDGSETVTVDEQKINIMRYLGSEAIFTVILFILTLLLWRSNTPKEELDDSNDDIRHRETFSINDPQEGSITGMFDQISKCLLKGSVRSMFVLFGVGFGLMTTIGSLLTSILGCFNYPEYYGPLLSVIVITSGLIGSLVYSVKFIKSRHQGKNMFPVVGCTAISCIALSMCLIYNAGFVVLAIVGSLFGIFGLIITVLVLEEIIRRIHEKLLLVASTLNAIVSGLISALSTYVIGFFIEEGNEYNGSMIVMSLSVGFVFLFFYCFIAERRMERDDLVKRGIKQRLVHESDERLFSSKKTNGESINNEDTVSIR